MVQRPHSDGQRCADAASPLRYGRVERALESALIAKAGNESLNVADVATIAVAIAALLFTVFSFWWIYARRGKITVATPTVYRGTTQQNSIILLFPLVFYNTGPQDLVLRDLRLRFVDEPEGAPLLYERVRPGVTVGVEDEPAELSSAFPVPGRTGVKLFCEFQRTPAGRQLVVGTYPLVLEALIGKHEKWRLLHTFDFHVNAGAAATMPSTFTRLRNQRSVGQPL